MAKELTDEEKCLAELILYISSKCLTHEKFGATKLNKILFFSDFIHFKQHGRPITGVKYFKLPKGPAPKCLLPVREFMVASGDLAIAHRPLTDGRIQQRTVALRPARISEYFDANQIEIVDQLVDVLKDKSAEEVSELSHLYVVGWMLYGLREEIPYHSVFARAMKEEYITESDIEKGRKIEERLSASKAASIQGD